jgi:hypothetical protein
MRSEALSATPSSPDLHWYWEQVRSRIDAELAQSAPVLFERASADLQKAVQRTIAGGKRIRGCLVCLVCEALDGGIEAAVPRALAIEYVQTASLLHDDFVDDDRVRRHRAAEWTVQGARRAVLLADVVFATAIEHMADALSASCRPLPAEVLRHGARSAAQEAALATEQHFPFVLPRLEQAMSRAVEERAAEGLAALGGFPPNAFTHFLRQLPAQVLGRAPPELEW